MLLQFLITSNLAQQLNMAFIMYIFMNFVPILQVYKKQPSCDTKSMYFLLNLALERGQTSEGINNIKKESRNAVVTNISC